ncbi:MAG: hypothetical protein ACYS8Z_05545 [Planctomycetota bacterium]|jgi:hypothetical protein
MEKRIKAILKELEAHAPFTLFGALTGIICMLIFKDLDHDTSEKIFYVFHPTHVVLSALVTASLFVLHTKKRNLLIVLAIGIFGSIGISTLSDSLIPYAGELLLGTKIQVHGHGASSSHEHEHEPGEPHDQTESHSHGNFVEDAHIGFIEGWYVVIPAAILGTLFAYFKPWTKFPHGAHVLLSTWASTFHMIMAFEGNIPLPKLVGSFGFLFLAVWLPCCISDIVFPLLFADSVDAIGCHHHKHNKAEQ